jgi:hypothetical protein
MSILEARRVSEDESRHLASLGFPSLTHRVSMRISLAYAHVSDRIEPSSLTRWVRMRFVDAYCSAIVQSRRCPSASCLCLIWSPRSVPSKVVGTI